MAKVTKQTNYFGQNEENAVVQFLNSDDETERNAIFKTHLEKPLGKMIESIIRRYKLQSKVVTFEELEKDTLSFLFTKAHIFNPQKKTKAYSYFGTIVKNYAIGQRIKDEKNIKQYASYEDISSSLEERPDLVYEIDTDCGDKEDISGVVIKEIEKTIENGVTESERKVGLAIIDIITNLKDTDDFVDSKSKKYNKSVILETMRNCTGLSTKEIRNAMKTYKIMYALLKTQPSDIY